MRVNAAKVRTATRRERRTLLAAVLASALVHLGLLVLALTLPSEKPPPLQLPLRVTIVEIPSQTPPLRAKAALPGPPGPALQGPSAPPTSPLPSAAGPGGPTGFSARPDAPFAVPSPLPTPSLEAVSKAVAEAVVTQRGPQHPSGNSAADRLAESLHRGIGAIAVLHSGFWDTYFTELRKVLLAVWSVEHVRAHASKATLRIQLVIDVEGWLRDFTIIIASGDSAMDSDVERALHVAARFPPPPLYVMAGRVELVMEWEFTVHPGLAAAQGQLGYGQLGAGMTFDMVTLVNPQVDLRPLERNVALASYWTR